MELQGAVVFLSGKEGASSLFLGDILFDPAALWLAETLRREGARRFLVVCPEELRPAAAPCFPEDTLFTAEAAGPVLADFLAKTPGPVAVVREPVLLAPENTGFALPAKELKTLAEKAVCTLRGNALAAALQSGKSLDEALTALGEAKPWAGRVMPLREDAVYRAYTVEPLAKRLGVERMLQGGVRVVDPESSYVGPAVTVGEGSTLLPGAILRGRTAIGGDCVIGPNALIRDCVIGTGVTVNSSQLHESTVGEGATVGPFAYVRPHCQIGKGVRVGDFVELKNSTIGEGTKISHLTYVGDTDAGAHINFGCGTVTVNYDGQQKFRTTIGDNAFIGCNTNLVAPVTVGEGAYTAAGSTITDDVPPDSLAIARDRQTVKRNWVKKRRNS